MTHAQESADAPAADEAAAERESWLLRIEELNEANLELARQNAELRDRLASARVELEQADIAESRRLDRSRRQWFVAGAGVMVAGILLGLILPRLRRRRSAWSDL
ncbi:MAG: hypothetical protein JJT85_01425 [Chromatiales bacterium]|nr:hypothetical protein [Chromatiales bacterium]